MAPPLDAAWAVQSIPQVLPAVPSLLPLHLVVGVNADTGAVGVTDSGVGWDVHASYRNQPLRVEGENSFGGAEWTVVLPLPPWALAVLVSVMASTFTVAGFVMQKKALNDPANSGWPKMGSIVLSPAWILGFLVTAILPVLGDLAAYSLAPLTLTTPLSGVSVVLNMVIAPWALSEQLQRFPDLPATLLILVGCIATTAFGDHDRNLPYSADELVRLSTRPIFIISVLFGALLAVSVVSRMNKISAQIERLANEQKQNPHLPHVMMPALAAALCGAVANIGLKGIGELVKGNEGISKTVFCILIVAPAAIAQVNFINRGLFLYPQSVFMSVYGALLVLSNTIYGALFFEEYKALVRSPTSFGVFVVGFFMIVQGIWLFKFRTGKVKDIDEESLDASSKEALLKMHNLGGTAEEVESENVDAERWRSSAHRCDDDGL